MAERKVFYVEPISKTEGKEQYPVQCPCCKKIFEAAEPETVCLDCGSLLKVDRKYFPHFNPFPPGVR